MIEIMSPAGSFEALHAAIKGGADSVYFGVENLNMRSRSANFTLDDLSKVADICKKANIKSYLALNTIIYDNDLDLMKKICDAAKGSGISAVIAMDIAVMQYARSINLEVHSSTQLNISNIEAVKFYTQFADVVVLARELTLEQITSICNEIKAQSIKGPNGELVKVEIFCHGAMCVSISGKCYMSLAQYNHSANRGACLQSCRRAYRVHDDETGNELVIDNKYVMSPKDLCTIMFLDRILESGVSVLKIEGRARGPEYVYTVTKAYKEAALSVEEGTFSKEKTEKWMKELGSVFNRGFWKGGYYLGKKIGEWSGAYGSKATKNKRYVGKVLNYFDKVNVAYVKLEAGNIKKGDELLITGPTTGFIKLVPESLVNDDMEVGIAEKGQSITFKVPEKVRKNDKVYLFN